MRNAVIVDAVRTPGGKRNGSLKDIHPVDLASVPLRALAAGFPEDTVGATIDRQCGSGQQAAHFAAQGVMAGAYDVVVAGGVESMTRVPMGVTASQGPEPHW